MDPISLSVSLSHSLSLSESGDMNLRKIWHTFLYHQVVAISLQLSTYYPLGRISLATRCVSMTQIVFAPQVIMM